MHLEDESPVNSHLQLAEWLEVMHVLLAMVRTAIDAEVADPVALSGEDAVVDDAEIEIAPKSDEPAGAAVVVAKLAVAAAVVALARG